MKKQNAFFREDSYVHNYQKSNASGWITFLLTIFWMQIGFGQQEFLLPLKTFDGADHSILDEKFEAYTAFELNTEIIRNYVKSQGETASLSLNIGGTETWDLSLEENEIRSEGFVSMTKTDYGYQISKKGDCVTYKGIVNGDPDKILRLVIDDNYFGGFITTEAGKVVIESAGFHLEETVGESSTFIAYETNKVGSPHFSCGTEDILTDPEEPLEPREGVWYGYCDKYNEEWEHKERYLELAAETDCEFISEFGDLTQAENRILELANNADDLYTRAANLRVIVVYIHFWGEPGYCTDIYSGGDANDRLVDMQLYWGNTLHYVHRDHVHLFSGRNLAPDGVSYNSSTCGFDGFINHNQPVYWVDSYSVSDYTGGPGYVFMHELGHALGMRHVCECTLMLGPATSHWGVPCNISCSSLTTEISAENHKNLCRFLNRWNVTYDQPQDICLVDPPVFNYEFDLVVSIDDLIINDINPFVCLGEEMTFTFFNTFDEYDITWSLGPNLELIEGELTDQTIKVKAIGYGPTYVEVTFPYNGVPATLKKEFGIVPPGGIPGPFSFQPIFASITPFEYEVFLGAVYGAEFYNYNLSIYNQNGVQTASSSGTIPNLSPFVVLDLNTCMIAEIVPGNVCGLSNETFTVEVCTPGYTGVPPNQLIAPENEHNGIVITEGRSSSLKNSSYLTIQGHKDIEKKAKQYDKSLLLFPNPTKNQVKLIFSEMLLDAELVIQNVDGKIVLLERFFNKKQLDLDIQSLSDGIYFVRISSPTGHFVEKLIIEN